MSLLEDLESLRTQADAAFKAAADKAALETARVEYLGTRGKLKATLGRMGEVPKEQKPVVGKRANEIGKEIEAFFEAAKGRVEGTGGQAAGGASDTHSSFDSLKGERLRKLKIYEDKFGKDSAFGTRF